MDTRSAQVVVAGAGPSGLAAAVELARHGVRVRVVDRGRGPVDQSRATIVHARTLEVLDRYGVADTALSRGVPIVQVELHHQGRPVAVLPLAGAGTEGMTRFPCALSLEQSETERILLDVLADLGITVDWGVSVQDVRTDPDGVTLEVRTDGGAETISTEWLVAADGASSTVRKALRIPFDGNTYPQIGMLADVTLDVTLPSDRLRLNLTSGGFVGILPLGGRKHRLFGAVPPGFAPDSGDRPISHESYAELSRDRLQTWFDDYFAVDGTLREVHWASLFRFHSRLAERYREGRVFLVGDAAHVHNPAGGQGMNLGVGDAVNMGWKLAAVIKGEASPALLDTYESERRDIARTIIRNTDRGFRMETTSNPVAMWLRLRVAAKTLGVLSRATFVRRTVFRMLSQTWIGYRRGEKRRSALCPGDRAPHAPLGAAGGSVLDVLRAGGFQLLLFEGLGGEIPAVTATDPRVHVVPRVERAAHLAYGAHRAQAVLIRPDGHVEAVGEPTELISHLLSPRRNR